MKVLGLSSYPVEAACARYRMEQFVGPLAERGITLTTRAFLDSQLFEQLYRREAFIRTAIGLFKPVLLRLRDVVTASQADVVMVQREAMVFGPPLVEWLVTHAFKRPMVLDLDDATYVSYTSPTYGSLGRTLKWFSKTDDLIRWAAIATCGNRAIAEYVSSQGTTARVIPTINRAAIYDDKTICEIQFGSSLPTIVLTELEQLKIRAARHHLVNHFAIAQPVPLANDRPNLLGQRHDALAGSQRAALHRLRQSIRDASRSPVIGVDIFVGHQTAHIKD